VGNSPPWGAVVMAVAHDEFKTLDISTLINGNSVVYDVKGGIGEWI